MKKTIIWSLVIMMGLSLSFSGPIFAQDDSAAQGDDAPVPTLYDSSSNGERKPEPRENKEIKPEPRQMMGSLEKILTPDQIRYFEKIIKEGNALYGVRKVTSTKETSTVNITPVNGETKKLELEKISTPQLIKFYEQIKKIGTSLWGVKKEDPKKSEPKNDDRKATSTPNNNFVKPEQAACVITAIETKDGTLKEGNTYQATQINNAISARTTCQKAALNLNASETASTTVNVPGQQREALKACVKTFETTVKAVREAAKKSHDTIWETYKTSLKACQPATSSMQFMIEDGGGNLLVQ
jgi:hypothetical protein